MQTRSCSADCRRRLVLQEVMAEQDAQSALRIADRGCVLEHGHVGREGTSAELGADDDIRQAYLGVG